jgi:hypothetical protein
MRVCTFLVTQELINRSSPNLASLCLEPGRQFRKVKTPEECAEFESLSGQYLQLRKQAQNKNGARNKSVPFRQGYYRNGDGNSEKLSWYRVPVASDSLKAQIRPKFLVSVRRLDEKSSKIRKQLS